MLIHHAMVVTSWDVKRLVALRRRAVRTGAKVTPLVESAMNGYQSFMVCPDGSKSGWENDELGDKQRAAIKAAIVGMRNADGSSPFEWCEVGYGSDDRQAHVTDHEWLEE